MPLRSVYGGPAYLAQSAVLTDICDETRKSRRQTDCVRLCLGVGGTRRHTN